MNLNYLAQDIYGVIEEKGHHGIEHTHVETLTFRQLLHLVDEWTEMVNMRHHMQFRANTPQEKAEARQRMYEEGADVLIVAFDLCSMHNVDLSEVAWESPYLGTIQDLFLNVPLLVGQMANEYRKERTINQEAMVKLLRSVGEILRRHGANALEQVERKMAINASRPTRYGTKEVSS